MFTGIIQTVGHIVHSQTLSNEASTAQFAGVRLTVSCHKDFLTGSNQSVQIGDSIAIQGACMTVTTLTTDSFTVDVSQESLSKTTGLHALCDVNLEKALSLSTPLGGHLVTGHIDGLGRVANIAQVGESWQLIITAPQAMGRYFATKGSACINGVSLTVNTVADHAAGCDLSFNLIPHTWQNTTLCYLKVGDAVNVEIDLIARYLERMMGR